MGSISIFHFNCGASRNPFFKPSRATLASLWRLESGIRAVFYLNQMFLIEIQKYVQGSAKE